MRWRIGEGRAVGSFALLATLLTYASPVTERVLWRWSRLDAGLIGVVALVFAVTLIGLMTPATGPIDGGHRPPGSSLASRWIDLGWLFWGLGYLIGSAFAPATRGRFFQFDLLNSVVPGASFLELGGAVAVLTGLGTIVWQRARWPVAILVLTPFALLAGGEGWARWHALYRPRATAIPSSTDTRWQERFAARNAAGFRDDDHPAAKPDGTSRVVVVGDEVAFGAGIADRHDRFPELLALRLATVTGRPWESIDLALPGSDTKAQLAVLPRALSYAPDAVVLLYRFDDIAYFAPVAYADPLATPPHDWREAVAPMRLLFTNSVLVQEGYLRARHRFPTYTGGAPLPVDPYSDSELVAGHLEDVRALVQGAEEMGTAALVVPFDVETGDPLRLARYHRFVAAAVRADIPVVPLDSALTGRPLGQLLLDTLDRRPSSLAHRIAADAVARRLVAAMGLAPVTPRTGAGGGL